MRHLLIAATLFAAPAVAFATGPHCALAPSPQEAATLGPTQAQAEPSISVPAPVNPQAQAARVAPKPPAASDPVAAAPPAADPAARLGGVPGLA